MLDNFPVLQRLQARALMQAMAQEVERKFLVKSDAWRPAAGHAVAICQFYLFAAPDRSLRVRIKDGKAAVLTLKTGGDALVRDEFEYAIPLRDAEAMMVTAIGNIVEKTRHHVGHGDHIYEVDVFAGALSGLVMAELETQDAVPDERLPAWLGREVTGEPAYYNASLATNGLPGAVS